MDQKTVAFARSWARRYVRTKHPHGLAEVTGEDGYGMFITARLAAALPPGKGKVVLKTPSGEHSETLIIPIHLVVE